MTIVMRRWLLGSWLLAGAATAQVDRDAAVPPLLLPLFAFEVGGGNAAAVAFSPDGMRLASGGERGDLIVWDRQRLRPSWSRAAGEHWIGAVAFSPDGSRVAAMGGDVTVWSVDRGELLFRRQAGGPHGLAWSADGRRLAYHSGNGIVNVQDTATWEIAACFQENQRYPINSLAFVRDDTAVLAGDNQGQVWRLQLEPQRESVVRNHPPRRSGTNYVEFVAQLGNDVVSAGLHGDVVVGEQTFECPGALYAAAVSAVGLRVAAAGADGKVVFWEGAGGDRTELTVDASVTALAFSPDGGTLALTTGDGRLELWRQGARVAAFEGHPSQVEDLAFTPDSRLLVAAGKHAVSVDLASRERRTLRRRVALAAGRQGSEIVVGDGRGFEILDARTWRSVARLVERGGGRALPTAFALRPDGGALWVGGGFAAEAGRYDLPAGDRTDAGFDRYLDLAWSPDGRRCAIGTVSGNHGESGSLLVRDADGRTLLERRLACGVDTVAFSPSGQVLVYAAGGGSLYEPVAYRLHVLDAASFDERLAREEVVAWLRFVDDRLALSHDASAITVWDATTWTRLSTLPFAGGREAALAPNGATFAISDGTRVQVYAVAARQR